MYITALILWFSVVIINLYYNNPPLLLAKYIIDEILRNYSYYKDLMWCFNIYISRFVKI